MLTLLKKNNKLFKNDKVWDKDQFETIGTPSITYNGIASNFSTSNYFKIGSFHSPKNNFKVIINIKTNTLPETGSYHFINSNYSICGFSMKIDAGSKRFVCYLSSNGTANDIATLIIPKEVKPNTDYTLMLTWDGKTYEFSCSENGINFLDKISVSSSLPIYTLNRIYSLGGSSYAFTLGSINLKSIKIYVDNILIFDGNRKIKIYDNEKVVVVGSPTISSSGMASNFTTSNYIKSLNKVNLDVYNFKIFFRFTTGSNIDTAQMIIRSMDGENAFIVGLGSGKMRLYLQSSTASGSWDIISGITSSNTLTTYTTYNACLSFDGVNYVLSLNNTNWITVKSSSIIRFSFTLKVGQGMSAEPFLGKVDLSSININSKSHGSFDFNKFNYQLFLKKATKWNKSQFTVVGSPSVSDDGVISGCSGSKYIKINNPIISVDNSFQINCIIPFGTGVPFVIYSPESVAKMFLWRTANNKLRVVLRSAGTDYKTLIDKTVVVPETSLNICCVVENNICLVEINGNILINTAIDSTVFFEALKSSKYFTFGSNIGNNPFNQPLDLKTFKIYTDNTLIFDGGAKTYVYDPNKFTIVGSPTITENGVASGFSGSNYLTFDTSNIDWTKPYHIKVKISLENEVDLSNMITRQNMPIIQLHESYGSYRFRFSPATSVEAITTVGQIRDTEEVVLGTTYLLEAIYDGTQYTFKKNGTVVGTSTTLVTDLTIGGVSILGQNTVARGYLHGSIDLKHFSITVDGKEVFSGAKTKYCTFKR